MLPRPWRYTIRLKHHLTESDDPKDLKESMGKVRKVMEKHECFDDFPFYLFDEIREELVFGMTMTEQCNLVLNRMYDFANDNRIWID